jgi:hypothetical protein
MATRGDALRTPPASAFVMCYGPEHRAILRKRAFTILQSARKDLSIHGTRQRAGWSDDFARIDT